MVEWPEAVKERLEQVEVKGRKLLREDGMPDPAILSAAAGYVVADVRC